MNPSLFHSNVGGFMFSWAIKWSYNILTTFISFIHFSCWAFKLYFSGCVSICVCCVHVCVFTDANTLMLFYTLNILVLYWYIYLFLSLLFLLELLAFYTGLFFFCSKKILSYSFHEHWLVANSVSFCWQKGFTQFDSKGLLAKNSILVWIGQSI